MTNPRVRIAVALLLAAAVPIAALQANPSARSPDQIYQTYCGACHGTGWNGAPIRNIEGDWEMRTAAGMDAMLANVKQGLNTMPPMGTCMDCSDAELRAVIEKMIE